MLKSLKQADFADGRGGNPIVFLLESDFLQSDDLPSQLVFALVYDTVRTLSKFLLSLVTLKLRGFLDKALSLSRLLGLHLSIHNLTSSCGFHY